MRKYFIIKLFVLLICNSSVFAAENFLLSSLGYLRLVALLDSTKIDSLGTSSKRKILPLFKTNNFANAISLKQTNVEKLDYRSVGDILSTLPFVFENNLGYLGQPSQLNIYGLQTNDIAFSIDGIPQNRVWNNFQNFYDIQSEIIDSIVMVSICQAFLYGNKNEYQSFLMFSKDHVQRKPFSRLRFYQAPNEEGFVSVYFNTFLLRKLIFSSEITNMAVSPQNDNFNNDFSNWQVNSKLRYLFSKSFNVVLGYSYSKNQTQLNGGAVNNSNMFDNLQASPIYPNRFQRNSFNQLSINFLADIIDSNRTDVIVYYQSMHDEFKQNKKGIDLKIPVIININNSKRIGLQIIQNLSFDKYNFEFVVSNESTTINSPYASNTIESSSWSTFVKASTSYSFIEPEIFSKILHDNSQNYFGAGGLVRINLNKSIFVKSGYSVFQKPLTRLEKFFIKKDFVMNAKALDISFHYKTKVLTSSLTYFFLNIDKYVYPILYKYSDSSLSNETGKYFFKKYSASGINFNGMLRFWKIKLNCNLNYYSNLLDSKVNSSPKYSGKFGLYFVDKLFDNNLDLMTGINANFFGEKSFVNLDFEKGDMIYYKEDETGNVIPINSERIKSNLILDFYLSGVIQKRANVFFIIENLLDSKYFIINYYPMFSRGIRLGVNWELNN